MNKLLGMTGFILLIFLSGCAFPSKEPSVETGCGETELCEEVSLEDRVGSFTLTIQREMDMGLTYTKCNGLMTVWFNTDPQNVAFGYLTFNAEGEWICNAQLGGIGTSGIVVTTNCDTPITYKVGGRFKPSPECSLTLDVTEILELSKMNNCVNSVLGAIPVDPAMLSEDTVTVFPPLTFLFPDSTESIPGSVVSNFTISDLVVSKETGCTFDIE